VSVCLVLRYPRPDRAQGGLPARAGEATPARQRAPCADWRALRPRG